jgi:hypothetical protein
MKCSICGGYIGGRGDRCQNNGLPWHNKVHKERYQRKKWGGPLYHWDGGHHLSSWAMENMPLIWAQLLGETILGCTICRRDFLNLRVSTWFNHMSQVDMVVCLIVDHYDELHRKVMDKFSGDYLKALYYRGTGMVLPI